uniref:Transmembrane protein n=1 Tax=Chrysotila carterae TaxID=13221 RepID=A0A7S4EUD3_CHRCT|mmetsp:Transcript_599/g.1215  ORF Transcript_599/g.1215 Transcript_599/m.1215 type:complete len:115 (-) Transcript_599:192-536(-)
MKPSTRSSVAVPPAAKTPLNKPPGSGNEVGFDAFCRRWIGLKARSALFLVTGSICLGAWMELFMIKVWIKDTNFYKVALKKEAERRAVLAAKGETTFADLLRQKWDEQQRGHGA